MTSRDVDRCLDAASELWRMTEDADVSELLEQLRESNRLLRRLNVASFIFGGVCTAVAGVLELISVLPTRGLVFALLAAVMIVAWRKYRSDKAKLQKQFDVSKTRPRDFLIGRLRAGRLAGYLLLAMPAYVLGGVIAGHLLAKGGANGDLFPKLSHCVFAILFASPAMLLGAYLVRRFQHALNSVSGTR